MLVHEGSERVFQSVFGKKLRFLCITAQISVFTDDWFLCVRHGVSRHHRQQFRTEDPFLTSRSYNRSASYQQMPQKIVKAFISVSGSVSKIEKGK